MEVKKDFKKRVVWLKENVLFIHLDDKKILVDTNMRIHYTPSETAAFLLNHLVNDSAIHHDVLKKKLIETFNLTDEEAKTALHNTLNYFDSDRKILGEKLSTEIVPVDLPAAEPAGERIQWTDAELVQGGTLITFGRVNFVKNVYIG